MASCISNGMIQVWDLVKNLELLNENQAVTPIAEYNAGCRLTCISMKPWVIQEKAETKKEALSAVESDYEEVPVVTIEYPNQESEPKSTTKKTKLNKTKKGRVAKKQ